MACFYRIKQRLKGFGNSQCRRSLIPLGALHWSTLQFLLSPAIFIFPVFKRPRWLSLCTDAPPPPTPSSPQEKSEKGSLRDPLLTCFIQPRRAGMETNVPGARCTLFFKLTCFCLSQGVVTGFLTRSSSGFLSISLQKRPIKAKASPIVWWILIQIAVWSFPGMSIGVTIISQGEISSHIADENCSLSTCCSSSSLRGAIPSYLNTCLFISKSCSSTHT